MTRLTFAILGVIVAAGSIISLAVHHHAAVKMRETNAFYHERAAQLARLKEENIRLASLISLPKMSGSLTSDQFSELLRLRGDVSRLRGEGREVVRLQVTNQQLLATLAKSGGVPPAQARWTRDQLAFAGYADPESAIVTTLWALGNGDPKFYLSLLTPDQKSLLEKEGQSEEIAAQYRKIAELLNPPAATGICLVGKSVKSSDEATVDLYYEGEGKTRRFELRRVDGDWKLQGLALIMTD